MIFNFSVSANWTAVNEDSLSMFWWEKQSRTRLGFKLEPIWIYLFDFHLQLKKKRFVFWTDPFTNMHSTYEAACQHCLSVPPWNVEWVMEKISSFLGEHSCRLLHIFLEMSQKEAFPTCWHLHHVRSMRTCVFCCFLAPGFPEHYLYSSSFDGNRPISQKKNPTLFILIFLDF